jgi:competence protein ComEA
MFGSLMKSMVVVAAMAVSGSALAASGKGLHLTPREVSGVININTATAQQLELLPGVGRHTAGLIVAYREKTPFKAAHEIVKVKGVGQGIFNHVKQYLTIAGPTTLAVAHAKGPATVTPPNKADKAPIATRID